MVMIMLGFLVLLNMYRTQRVILEKYIPTVKHIGVPRSMYALFLIDIKSSLIRQQDWSLTIWHTIGDILSFAHWSAEMDD